MPMFDNDGPALLAIEGMLQDLGRQRFVVEIAPHYCFFIGAAADGLLGDRDRVPLIFS
jgi:hypothetical protein